MQTINDSTEIDAGLQSIIPTKHKAESRSLLKREWFQLHEVPCTRFCLHWVYAYTNMFTHLLVQTLHLEPRIYDCADPRRHGQRIKFMSCSPSRSHRHEKYNLGLREDSLSKHRNLWMTALGKERLNFTEH